MSESLIISGTTRAEQYASLIPQIKALTEGESDFIANLANIVGALKQGLHFFWVGVYLVKENELVLGPFQGPIACTRIQKGKGVCGTAWDTMQTILVPDVDAFPGHIACSSEARSEIVVPLFNRNRDVIGVLDIDSDQLSDFDAIDKQYLEQIAVHMTMLYHRAYE